MTTLLWLRNDLRLKDHPALQYALANGPVLPVFIWAPQEEGAWPPGGASQWWLRRSLLALNTELAARGSRLLLYRAGHDGFAQSSLEVLQQLIQATGAHHLCWSRRYEPACIQRDAKIKKTLKAAGVQVESFNAALLFEPWEVQTGSGGPFQVFTPFWKCCLKRHEPPEPLPAPRTIPAPKKWPALAEKNFEAALAALNLEPRLSWASGFEKCWTPGEKGAHTELKRFLEDAVGEYCTARDRPDQAGTSRLSPHLHFGEISPREIWHAARAATLAAPKKNLAAGEETFLKEIGWREFAHHLLYHFPHTPKEPLREAFKKFPWHNDKQRLKAWQRGQTGYPYIDAGLRELWTTGWMHNRVRMAVASFLVKDLRLPWQRGAEWFWDTLVDADLASNTLGWQWTAGCGADAAPYFRVFNPISQGMKFDPHGHYVKTWVPELARLEPAYIHKPFEAPPLLRSTAGIELGKTYPRPMVDHAVAREEALAAWQQIR